jgi:hypothetical protein
MMGGCQNKWVNGLVMMFADEFGDKLMGIEVLVM